ncbi:MAG: hypothetical protein CMJ89_11010 [Planctomycetes bacterium]|nr:hypothetical protein [Planctomycetota bacterium]
MHEPRTQRNDTVRRQARSHTELLRRARCELEHVHRQEIVRLFRQAAAIASSARVEGDRCHPLLTPLRRPPTLCAWKGRVADALDWEGRRGKVSASGRVLSLLAETPLQGWPGPTSLVRFGLRLGETEALRLDLGFARLTDGEPVQARVVFRELLARLRHPRQPWLIFEGLSFAEFLAGNHGCALAAIERAADDPRCRVCTIIYALVFAFLSGQPEDLGRAAARLELMVDGTAPEFQATFARIARWVRSDRSPRVSSMRVARSFAEDLDVRSPVGRVLGLVGVLVS